MKDIYRRAARLVAWIGEDTERSNCAMSFLREIAMARKLNLRRSWINGVRQGSDTSSECRDGTFLTDGSPGRDNSGSSSSADEENEEQLSQGGAEELSGNEDAESFVSDESPGMQDVGEKAPLPGAKSAEVEPSPGQESLPEPELPPAPRNQPARPTLETYLQEHDENWKRQGHIVVGYPILYYDFHGSYGEFFKDSRQADWEALDDLLSRPWWSRTWVVQELWHSGKAILQCGNATLKWKTFEKAMDYHEGWDDIGYLVKTTSRWQSWDKLKRRYGLAIHISKRRLLGSKLSDLLWNMWDREATDPRDKVFAVLGLVGEEGVDLLPDYSKPLGLV